MLHQPKAVVFVLYSALFVWVYTANRNE